MARKSKDVLGIDELIKTFDKMESRFESKATAMLAAQTRQAKKRVKQQTPVSNKKHKGGKDKPLKQTWKEKKPKEYQNGKYMVGMVYSDANHAHLYELGHEMVTRTRTRGADGRYKKEKSKMGKLANANFFKKRNFKAKKVGFVPGNYVLAGSLEQAEARWGNSVEKILDEITKDVQ